MRTHHARDQDLLLITHGALPPWRRALTAAHLRRCPVCRERSERLALVSGRVAGAIRGPSDPPWRPPVVTRPVPWALLAAVTVLLFAVSLVLLWGRHDAQQPPPVRALSLPCRPDLPNDHCR